MTRLPRGGAWTATALTLCLCLPAGAQPRCDTNCPLSRRDPATGCCPTTPGARPPTPPATPPGTRPTPPARPGRACRPPRHVSAGRCCPANAEWDAARRQCTRDGTIALTVTSPGGAPMTDAEVSVDDVVVPLRQFPRRFPAGVRRVRVSARGMAPVTREVVVLAAEVAPLAVQLGATEGTVRVVVRTPPGVPAPTPRVTIDGVAMGGSPPTGTATAGTHRVEVSADGFRAVTREVTVAPEGSHEVSVALEPLPGTVRVTVATPGAQVFLDDRRADATPAVWTNVAPGAHRLRVTAPGHRERVSNVVVLPGATAAVEVLALESDLAAATCARGRVSSDRTMGHCCWENQVWANGACRGVPRCPAGFVQRAEACEAVCADGRVSTGDDAVCCWPGQAAFQGACRGVPRCPPDRLLRGEACVADRGVGLFRSVNGGVVGIQYDGSVADTDVSTVHRVGVLLGMMPGPVEILLNAGYTWGNFGNRSLSTMTGGVAFGAQALSFPRGDLNWFSPVNLSLGLHADFVALTEEGGGSLDPRGRFGFYVANTAFVACGLAVRLGYSHTLVGDGFPSSLHVALLGAGRGVCR